jgi:hypothetical protein
MTAPTAESRPQARGRRRHGARKITVSATRGAIKRSLAAGAVEYPEAVEGRPRTRGECAGGERPCPYAGCQYNLYLDVAANGSIILNFPDLEPVDMEEAGRRSCALDVADRGGARLETIADLMNLTRERVRQLEARALARLETPRVEELHAEART